MLVADGKLSHVLENASVRPNSLKKKCRELPDTPGVYLMKDRLGRIIYVGKAKSLKKRVSSYFQHGSRARRGATQDPRAAQPDRRFRHHRSAVRAEALLLEGKLIKQWRPRYNTDFTDDKRFLLVRVDPGEELPRFRLTRLRKEDRSRYFGPFAHSGLLRKTLAQMRRQFGILLADATPQQLSDGTWKLYDDVREEIYGGEHTVTAETYRARVAAACEFLEGKSREWLAALRAEMQAAAASRRLSRRGAARHRLRAGGDAAPHPPLRARRPVQPAGDAAALASLQEALGLPEPPRTMECFDISHISGTFVVASMVRFADGRPDRDQYRRFQIKSFIGNDDFRAMEEVVGRRYRRLATEQKPFPDLVVIDGGQGRSARRSRPFSPSTSTRRRSSAWRRKRRR